MNGEDLFSIEVKSGCGTLIAPHYHADSLEFVEVLKGEAVVTVGLFTFRVQEGGILHLLPGAVHYAVAAEGRECFLRSLTYHKDAVFTSRGLDEQFFSLYILPIENRAVFFAPEHPLNAVLSAHMETAVSEWRGKDIFYNALILAEIAHMLAIVLRFFGYSGEDSPEYRNRMRVAPTVRHIESCYSQKLRLEDLAATLYLSPDHFGKLFRATVGLTPVEYINHVRVNAAMRRLASTDASIGEIAKDSGFANANYFHKVFHDLVGIGPAALRKQWRAM